jgi:hypothetical protein
MHGLLNQSMIQKLRKNGNFFLFVMSFCPFSEGILSFCINGGKPVSVLIGGFWVASFHQFFFSFFLCLFFFLMEIAIRGSCYFPVPGLIMFCMSYTGVRI